MKKKKQSVLKTNKAKLAKLAPGAYETDICPRCGFKIEWEYEGSNEPPSDLMQGVCRCGFKTKSKAEKGGHLDIRGLFAPVILAELKKATDLNEVFHLVASQAGATELLPVLDGLVRFLFASRDAKTPMMVDFGMRFPGGDHIIRLWASHGITPVARAVELVKEMAEWKQKYMEVEIALTSKAWLHTHEDLVAVAKRFRESSLKIKPAERK